MGDLTCMKCKQTLYVPPSTQPIRCLGCKAIYTNDTNDVVHYKRTKDLGLEFAKKNTAAKHLCCSLMEKLPSSNEQQVMHPHRSRSTAEPNMVTAQVQCSFIQHKAIISGQRSLQRLDTLPSPPAVYKIYHLPRGRRALLCGVSYKKQKHELKRSAQDVKNMRELLLKDYNFPTESILILAEEKGHNLPTRKNIEEGFKWLMRDIQSGDSLVFYFSGHGKGQRDFIGVEDGFDKTICPMDCEQNGMILDNYINEAIVRL